MEKSKVLRINKKLFEQLSKRGKLSEVVKEIIQNYKETDVTLKQDSNFVFSLCFDGKQVPFSVTGVSKLYRVPVDVYNALTFEKLTPEESISSILFRLLEVSRKQEVVKPFFLHLFMYPREEWFDEKGDFAYHVPGVYTGPMLESSMMYDCVCKISELPYVKEYVDIRIISCHDEPELIEKYTKGKKINETTFPFYVFSEVDNNSYPRFHICTYEDIADLVTGKVKEITESNKQEV